MTKPFFSLLLALAALGGCGYHIAGHDDALPKNIHSIAVPAFVNKTSSYRIEQKLTAATIREFLEKTPYKITSNPANADALLTAQVLSVEATPLLFISTPASSTTPSSTTRATTMLVTVTCSVTLTDSATQKVLYHSDNFLFRNEYEVASGNSTDVRAATETFFEEQDPALNRLAKDFAQRLVAAVTENF
jgi:outer membrane lipopolysaccharide assembly protein LptE/RlpB